MTFRTKLDETVASRYQLQRLLAHSRACEVFSAFDQEKGARVALKRQLSPATQRSSTLCFMREYHTLSELRHPGIVAVYDYGVEREQPYYTMELLDGPDLSELAPVPYRTACRYLCDVASALALLHGRRLLHRDLSPRNVRRTSDGRCKLLGFAAAVPFGVAPNLSGTPAFLSPEAVQGGPLDQRSDLYSLGALAYFVLTGKVAHGVGDTAGLARAWKKQLQRPSRIVSELPAALDELVISLLSVDPLQRPASANEVIERFAVLAGIDAPEGFADARSSWVSSRLIAREKHCERLRDHVSRALAGSGSTLLLSAESGMGRSRMLAEAARIARAAGLTVVHTVARAQAARAALASELVQALLRAAPVEAQRALAAHPSITSAADSGEWMLRELSAFVREIATRRPLLITVDDLQHADELSGSLIAALAYQCSDCSLCVVASYDIEHEAPALAQVPGLAETIWLGALDRSQTTALAATWFGDVPNIGRIGTWLYRIASGNLELTLRAAEHLHAQELVRCIDGSWVLPREVELELPTCALQLQGLSAPARALAELLCLARVAAPLERVLELSRQPPSAALSALGELVRRGVLESAGQAYAFTEDALRASLLDSLMPARRQQLHTTWAEHLLSNLPSAEEQLAAAWHMVHTREELAGAELLARVASRWIERREHLAVAVPALERALEVYTRHGRPQLQLRSLLVMVSCLFDPRLADRHARATLDALFPMTGLALTERWSQRLGKPLAFVCASAWTLLRWLVQPRDKRGPHMFDALKYYARAAMGLVGVRALQADSEGVQSGFERMRLFEGVPHPALQQVFALAKALTQGRAAETEALSKRLDVSRRPALQMSKSEQLDLLAGTLLIEGIHACDRGRSNALSYIARLEQLATPLASAAALRLSMRYYKVRGEAERKGQFRRLIELSAIQHGNVWQIEAMAVPPETLLRMIWSDPRESTSLGELFRRGDYVGVVRAGEHFMQEHPPFSQPGWACAYAQIALSHIELSEPARALAICEYACPLLYDNHREYMVHHSTLEAAYAVALVANGQRERGEDKLRMVIERLQASGEHTRAFLMYEYRIKVVRLMAARQAARAVLKEMHEAALAQSHPGARARAKVHTLELLPLRAASGSSQVIR